MSKGKFGIWKDGTSSMVAVECFDCGKEILHPGDSSHVCHECIKEGRQKPSHYPFCTKCVGLYHKPGKHIKPPNPPWWETQPFDAET